MKGIKEMGKLQISPRHSGHDEIVIRNPAFAVSLKAVFSTTKNGKNF